MSDRDAPPTPAERHAMIAVAAYYLAERRGFAPGGAEADWLAAERAIDAMLAARQLTGPMDDATRARLIRNALRLQGGAGAGATHVQPDPTETAQP
ncbi:DUF2934 domain-containing protein [Thermochromatium tepidum]|uniref:DUF2934 domain-containing protein n=1 Tax=Thermochromatium tepidum ATCC 43061 TaxID=316276 RepID=A0A6I6E7T1_THETI|nr:DUF2934 domain-containing protein [Thermochromatium tepidum]QGU32588.1 DUF2934 domain-containing protein [Thermochromatium tepidum ATCC 43061]